MGDNVCVLDVSILPLILWFSDLFGNLLDGVIYFVFQLFTSIRLIRIPMLDMLNMRQTQPQNKWSWLREDGLFLVSTIFKWK